MPELPEVQTTRDGLAPYMEGFIFESVTLNRADLRFAFAPQFIERLEGTSCQSLTRRAKFLKATLSSGEILLMHLGMSGRFSVIANDTRFIPASYALPQSQAQKTNSKHDHVIFEMSSGARIIFNDPRRFGFMELFGKNEPIKRLAELGPEPLSNHFNGPALYKALKGRKTKIKMALLDQRNIAGLGNIYVCEALYRTGLRPSYAAGRITHKQAEHLCAHIKDILNEAIKAGGSSLQDFAGADGRLGYFQHRFDVYGREGQPCHNCKAPIQRISQAGRSTFYCQNCQK